MLLTRNMLRIGVAPASAARVCYGDLHDDTIAQCTCRHRAHRVLGTRMGKAAGVDVLKGDDGASTWRDVHASCALFAAERIWEDRLAAAAVPGQLRARHERASASVLQARQHNGSGARRAQRYLATPSVR